MLQLSDVLQSNHLVSVEAAYEQCRQITAKYSKTFYMGTLLMTPPKRRAIWAIYVWCRRTDELVDGPQAATTTEDTLDRWERRLETLFRGHPVDDVDVALVDTLEAFPLDIQPFRDMIAGQRMDLHRDRYQTFEELELYCYRVAGTVGLMSTTIMGVDTEQNTAPWNYRNPKPDPTQEAIALGIANQLTNILRDVGEDARMGRIYLPLDWLADAGIDPLNFVRDPLPTPEVQRMVKRLLAEANRLYLRSEAGIDVLPLQARTGIWAARLIYAGIGKQLRRQGYDSISMRARTSGRQKLGWLMQAGARTAASLVMPTSAVIYAKPLPEVAFLVDAASRANPEQGRSNAVLEILAELKARDAGIGTDRPMA